jgi:DNA-binding MarR family transcriptional regulator
MAASDQRVLHLLQLAAHRVRTHGDRSGIAVAGVTMAQAGALFAIHSKPGATQRELARMLKQGESAVTAMVTRLLEAKLVERRTSAVDERAWSLFLTPKGAKALLELRKLLNEMNARLTDALGEDGVQQLAAALRLIGSMEF